METKYLSTSKEDIELAAKIIRGGGLVAFPTETVYGLGGDALNAGASAKIYAAKGRPSDNPLIVHIADIEELYGLAAEVPEEAVKLAEAFWPGPLTMVLPKKDIVPDATTGGLKTVAIRMPQGEAAQQLIRLSGVPIAAPSANTSQHPSPTAWEHVKHDLDGNIDAVICGEKCEGGIESTVLDMTDPAHPQILRPGLITPEDIGSVLNCDVTYDPAILKQPGDADPENAKLVPKAPGMKYRHYAPKAPLTIYRGEDRAAVEQTIKLRREEETAAGKKVAVLFGEAEDPRTAARDFFAELRRIDEQDPDLILAAALPDGDSVAFSVMNRMLKAAGYNVIDV